MEQLFNVIQKRKKLFWFITLFYILFNGCFIFPFNRAVIDTSGSLDFTFLTTVIAVYTVIAFIFGGLLIKKVITVFLLSLISNAIGMVFRYVLEFGEVSNTVNFTMSNILISLLAIPLFITIVYFIINKYNQPKKSL
ncbi:hypothetical protein ACSVDA_20965 [Cytobacillus sp. Hm23]